MEIKGIIKAVLDRKSGTSARGEWVKQDFVLEIPGQYPKNFVFSVFGAERLQQFNINQGDSVLVKFDVDAHEYNGKWYNDITAYSVMKEGVEQNVNQQQYVPQQAPAQRPVQQVQNAPWDNAQQNGIFGGQAQNNNEPPF